MPGTTVVRGNILASFIIGPSLTPVACAQATSAEQSFTVNGLQLGDYVNVSCNVAQTAGISIANARVSAANTLTVSFANSTAGSLTPVAGVYLIAVDRPESTIPTNAA